MAILRSGKQLRLSGKDAVDYLRDTGRNNLPKTVAEYNTAIGSSANAWRGNDCPEGDLLAAIIESGKKEYEEGI